MWRQLPAGPPGAYELLANLLGLGAELRRSNHRPTIDPETQAAVAPAWPECLLLRRHNTLLSKPIVALIPVNRALVALFLCSK